MNGKHNKSSTVSCETQKKPFGWAIKFLKNIWFVPAIAVLVVMLFLIFEHTRLSEVGRKFFAALIYSAFIGIPSSFLLNWIGFRFTERIPRLIALINVTAFLATATAGTLAGGLVFQIAGLVPPRGFWPEFWSSYPIAIFVTLIFGLSMTSFETMRHKLQSATLALRTQQVEQERANKLLVETRLSSLESRIHPHFLFNTLNSIAALIPSDPARAEDTVGKLASLLRFSLNANHNSLVPLAQELKVVRDYLEIESTRFGPRLRYEITVPESLGPVKVPPLALQSLVENSVKHVAAQRSEGVIIQIAGTRMDGRVQLEVIDDGPGFSLGSISPEHGLGNLSARLQLLFDDAGQLNVAHENGKTVARMSFPAES
jgi:two-component system, LytTR family, sensor histidine kinase AlgZ